ncbi:hypothetical protein N7491_005548 [Penicillium cf. griseofulvum]|nr:hypothetical protein N7491_005548 [Penicillium cf. griseofulvum]
MDQDTHQDTKCLLLELLLEDVNDEIDGFEAQLLAKDTNQPASRLEEAESDRGMALHIWKSEIERQRVILSDFQMATTLSLREEAEERLLPKKTRTLAKFISTFIQKIVHYLKNIMRLIKVRTAADSSQPEICTSCREIYSEVVKTQCSHFYCNNCLIRMVTKSLRDESLFPLNAATSQSKGSALAQEQKKRETELSDPDRTYCSDSACSRYILPATKFWFSTFSRVCTCKCGVRTCRKCKKSAHRGKCLHQVDRPFEKLMKQKKWQRCSRCGRTIELNGGCPHITMSDLNMGTAMSMGLETEDDLAKYETKRPSYKSLPIAIQRLGDSLSNAINLTDSPKSAIWRKCVSCRDDQLQDDMIKTKCSHFYCKVCLIRLFTDSLRDESLFPPQCCHISIAASKKMIGPELVQKHKVKAIELSDPDRTYCCNVKCAEYLPRNTSRNGVCKCASCGERTCRKCKKHAHEGKCVYKFDALLEKLAECKKWQRCSNCSRLIELSTGCNQITCFCKFEFCYFCGEKWKTCECSYADEENLYERP